MPNCFQLFKIDQTTGEVAKEASKLQTIDKELCKYMGIVEGDNFYCLNWYDSLGFLTALGRSWLEIYEDYDMRRAKYLSDPVKFAKEIAHYDTMLKMIKWFTTNYSQTSWKEFKT